MLTPPLAPIKGRGSLTNERSRFEAWRRERVFDDLGADEPYRQEPGEPQERPRPRTTV